MGPAKGGGGVGGSDGMSTAAAIAKSVPAAFARQFSSASSSVSRNAGLDFLRCVAVLLVIGRHLIPNLNLGQQEHPFLQAWYQVGWLGVDVFFVLSGYLISGLIFTEYARTGGFKLGRFLVRRGLKIYPAYYAFIGYSILKLNWEHMIENLWPGLILIQNYVSMGGLVGKFGHTWSLAVEEHFYLFFSISIMVVVSCVKSWRRLFVPVVACIYLVCLVERIVGLQMGTDKIHLYVWSHLRIDALLVGVLLRYLVHGGSVDPRDFSPWTLSAAIGIPWIWAYFVSWEDPWMLTVGLTVLPLSAAAMVLLCTRSTLGVWVVPFAWVGRHSYGIYLWHFAVLRALLTKVSFIAQQPLPLQIVLVVGACLAMGVIVTWAVEMPVLFLRDRFFPSTTSHVPRTEGAVAQPAAVAQRA